MSRFCDAVDKCSHLKGYTCAGLQALGSDSKFISVEDNKKLEGSVDIDSATKSSYPQDCRWDYAIGYNNRVYYVEVHPANTSNVKEVIKKLKWLTKWLSQEAKDLDNIPKNGFHWIHSGKSAILKTSSQERMLAQSGIKRTNHLTLK